MGRDIAMNVGEVVLLVWGHGEPLQMALKGKVRLKKESSGQDTHMLGSVGNYQAGILSHHSAIIR